MHELATINRRFCPSLTNVLRSLVSALLLCAIVGCAKAPYTWAAEIPAERAKPGPQREDIRAGDLVSVTVVGQAAISGQQVVGADGTISVPNVGAVAVGGETPKQAEATLTTSLSVLYREPKVSLTVVTRSIEVTVLGEVETPGKQILKSGDGVAVALALAGGINEFGDEDSIFLVRPSEPLRIRFRMDDLVRGGDSARAFSLRDGDLLVIE